MYKKLYHRVTETQRLQCASDVVVRADGLIFGVGIDAGGATSVRLRAHSMLSVRGARTKAMRKGGRKPTFVARRFPSLFRR